MVITMLTLALALAAGAGEAAFSDQPAAAPPEPIGPVPSERQLAWHELEYYAFIHFNMNTFTDQEWGKGDESSELFNPTELDCRQWARVCRDAGMKAIIITAKHHDGFCLWPSALTEHSVKSSPWRGGRGDLLRELAEACAEHGLKLGIYMSPWDRHEPSYGDSEKYNRHFIGQLTEVLSGYGEIFEVWFDGACGEGPNGRRQVYDWPAFIETVRKLQPGAVIFSDAGPDIRWVGNENGFAGETNWCLLDRDRFVPGTPDYRELTSGHRNGTHWVPAEADVSIRPGWYYHASQDGAVKTLEELVEIYFKSVGRNAALLLNLPVDRRGLVHENDAARLMELRRWLDAAFDEDLALGKPASADSVRGAARTEEDAGTGFAPKTAVDGDPATYWAAEDRVHAASLEIDLGAPTLCNVVMIEEQIALGQRVENFIVEGLAGGEWRPLASGTTIGSKRLLRFPATAAEKVRLRILAAKACPAIRRFSLFLAPPPAAAAEAGE